MRCPICKSEVWKIRATVDSRSLRMCSNPNCQFEILPKPDKRSFQNSTAAVEVTEAEYNGKFAAVIVLIGFLLLSGLGCTGCTVRGGWPRFLRWGEASDGAIRRELAAREGAVADLAHLLDLRATSSVDLEAVGKSLVKKWGRDGASYAVYDAWPHEDVTNACNVMWVQNQPARVQDLAWLICYRQQWDSQK